MKVRYLGEYTREARSYGCSRCGTSTTHSSNEVYKTEYRMYYEGRLFVFRKGEVQEVADDIQGRYLLNLKHRDKDGAVKPSFEEVNDGASQE